MRKNKRCDRQATAPPGAAPPDADCEAPAAVALAPRKWPVKRNAVIAAVEARESPTSAQV